MPEDASPQASSPQMMRTTKSGRPFLEETLDLFATLIVSLQLTTHKQFFRSFPNTFSTDEAAASLASLKFSQSNRVPDPKEPSRVITRTTTTTFTMTRDMAKAVSQQFMEARLIENATDPSSNEFKDRGLYVLTPKGLHILERFISRNGVNGDHLAHVFATQPVCMKLLHLKRRSADDEIIVSQSVINTLFRRFAGRQANEQNQPMDPTAAYYDRGKGIELMDVTDRPPTSFGKSQAITHRFCFAALIAIEWLCDFVSVVDREEAAEIAAQFVRFGLITFVSDKQKNNDSAFIVTVRGSVPGGSSTVTKTGEFRCTSKAIYKITEEGIRTARWDMARAAGIRDSRNSSAANLSTTESSSFDKESHSKHLSPSDVKSQGLPSLSEKLDATGTGDSIMDRRTKESNTELLQFMVDNPTLCHLFREFLRDNICEENLAFWLEVQDFKRKFNITSSASCAAFQRSPQERSDSGGGKVHTHGQRAKEQHHEALIQQAYAIYKTFLGAGSESELNIDHGLRNELSTSLSEIMESLTGKPFKGRLGVDHMRSFNATQISMMIRLYERIQARTFQLMANDSVPKFTKTPRFLAFRSQHDELDFLDNDVKHQSSSDLTVPPGLKSSQEIGGMYVTMSHKGVVAAHGTQPRTSGGAP
ncbi:regulator of G protein signaling [Russula brevipes]|nr:regulator of G protein signaling [Russula brevipes]